mgnify:CR=1 FL=1
MSATAERDGMELIAVVMAAPTAADRFEDAKAMLGLRLWGVYTYAGVSRKSSGAHSGAAGYRGTDPA